jgi:hypothetical protein
MEMCVMAGFSLYTEPWISGYLDNPDFIEYTDYYVKKATTNPRAIEMNDENVNATINSEEFAPQRDENTPPPLQPSRGVGEAVRSDEEINNMLNLDEYYFERFHLSNAKKRDVALEKRRNTDLAKQIYTFMKNTYTNPLSLKEIARISIRNHLLAIDHRMKLKVERHLSLPNRLKDYLLMREFNL